MPSQLATQSAGQKSFLVRHNTVGGLKSLNQWPRWNSCAVPGSTRGEHLAKNSSPATTPCDVRHTGSPSRAIHREATAHRRVSHAKLICRLCPTWSATCLCAASVTRPCGGHALFFVGADALGGVDFISGRR